LGKQSKEKEVRGETKALLRHEQTSGSADQWYFCFCTRHTCRTLPQNVQSSPCQCYLHTNENSIHTGANLGLGRLGSCLGRYIWRGGF